MSDRSTLSTHVLDTTNGQPAAGVRVRLFHGDALAGKGVTDADGRLRDLGGDLAPGEYRLVFDVGGYGDERGFFRRVTLEIELASGNTHVPLLLSRYGITSYRGS